MLDVYWGGFETPEDVTEQTRLESFIQKPCGKRHKMILEVLGDESMIARTIATKLGANDLNYVKPRLTELKQMGLIVSDEVAFDEVTKRHVALWRKA